MFTNKYSTESLFPYADGYYAIFPKGLEKNRKVGKDEEIVLEALYRITYCRGSFMYWVKIPLAFPASHYSSA